MHHQISFVINHIKNVSKKGVKDNIFLKHVKIKKRMKKMKIIGWNVNGLRACMKKGEFQALIEREDPDIVAIQETKMQENQLKEEFRGYYRYMSSAERKGYSGTMVLTKKEPLKVSYDFPGEHPMEGRVITLEYPDFYFVDTYIPNFYGLSREKQIEALSNTPIFDLTTTQAEYVVDKILN